MEKHSIVRILADLRLSCGSKLSLARPPACRDGAPALLGSSVGVMRARMIGTSKHLAKASSRCVPMPPPREEHGATHRRTPRLGSNRPAPSAADGSQSNPFGSQNAGDSPSPYPQRRTSRQRSGTTPWAGISPNPLPVHGEIRATGTAMDRRNAAFVASQSNPCRLISISGRGAGEAR